MADTFALVTPSYWRDLELCRLLAESVDRWVPESVPHYLVVTRADRPLFEPMANSRRRILIVEDLLPWWLVQLHPKAPAWLSLRSLPVKNWILQQIVKFAVPEVVAEDVLYYADSDMFFVKPFNPTELQRDGATPFFSQSGQTGQIPDNLLWQDVSADLLGLPRLGEDDDNFVNQLVPMRRDLMLDMLARIQAATGKPWQVAIARLRRFSEYTLYGVYCQRVAAEAALWRDSQQRVNNYWGTDPLDRPALAAMREATEPQHVAAMISAKSHTPVGLIREAFLPSDPQSN